MFTLNFLENLYKSCPIISTSVLSQCCHVFPQKLWFSWFFASQVILDCILDTFECYLMRFLLLFKSCGEFLYFWFSRQFSVSGCKFQPAFCGLWSQYKFRFQAFAALLRSVPCSVMILSHTSVLRVCDQIHMRGTWDAPRSPQTAVCRCFPMLLPLSGLLSTSGSSGLSCSIFCPKSWDFTPIPYANFLQL